MLSQMLLLLVCFGGGVVVFFFLFLLFLSFICIVIGLKGLRTTDSEKKSKEKEKEKIKEKNVKVETFYFSCGDPKMVTDWAQVIKISIYIN